MCSEKKRKTIDMDITALEKSAVGFADEAEKARGATNHIGYSFRLTARVLLYAPSHRQDSTYHGLCYTSRGALAGTRNSSMGTP